MTRSRAGASRILLAGVEDSEDADDSGLDAIDEQIIGMHDRLARAGRPTRPVHFGKIFQLLRVPIKQCHHPLGSRRVAICYIRDDIVVIARRVIGPDQLHAALPFQ